MQLTALSDIALTGELAYRIGRNFSRLEDRMYRPEEIFQADQQGWPGDWEGRTILALALHEAITHRKAAYLDAILNALENEWNEQGYLKDVHPAGIIDEQQLSGHNWLLRGLLELYTQRRDPALARRAQTIVNNLYLPLRGQVATYPAGPQYRVSGGGAAGEITGQTVNGWRLSTDIGCAFICLDSLSVHYDLFGGEALRSLLWELADAFRRIDLVGCRVQTHATLSALRGILRFYESERNPALLALVQDRFDLYLRSGMTATYANYNWFGRPEWTEPCAIVDSYLLAVHLFRCTKAYRYIALANRIYYNALLASQRPNGGFGCDTCTGELTAVEGAYEAYWCCSMRGAEGLSFAAASAVMREDSRIYITGYIPGTYSLDGCTVKINTQYPKDTALQLTVSGAQPGTLLLYLPEDAQAPVLHVNGTARSLQLQDGFAAVPVGPEETSVSLRFALQPRAVPAGGCFTPQGSHLQQLGDLIIGHADADACLLCDRLYLPQDARTQLSVLT